MTEPRLEDLIDEARRSDTSWERLWELYYDERVAVRRALVENENLLYVNKDGFINTTLMEELSEQFPEEMAAHPLFVLLALIEPIQESVPVVIKVLERSRDQSMISRLFCTCGALSWTVREAAAMNPNTPTDLLRVLGNETTEPHWVVRQAVAGNPNTPQDLLVRLSQRQTESCMDVRNEAALHLENRGAPRA